ncbi:hypothetical protein GF324_12195 [bacterium]|nr:hypothetical protein [bacterium]
MPAVTVFGSGADSLEEATWADAVKLGQMLAFQGCEVVTGGYGGIMAAVSEGAAKIPGATITGVLHLPPDEKPPNQFINNVIEAMDYQERMATLLRVPSAIAFGGGSGTFAEVAVSIALLERFPGRRLAIKTEAWKHDFFQQIKHSNAVLWWRSVEDLYGWIESLHE